MIIRVFIIGMIVSLCCMQFKVDLLFGDQNLEYQAMYVGTACHSTVYTLDGLLTPWSDENLPELLDSEYLSMIPGVSDEADLFNVTYACGHSEGARFLVTLFLYFSLCCAL